MFSRRVASQRRVRCLGIGLLILGFSHFPLPRADYHTIRHHDRPGEVCALHEHLLRWHPDARSGDDVPVLHWHWFIPTPGWPNSDPDQGTSAIHAHVPDWLALTSGQGPAMTLDPGPRLVGRAAFRAVAAFDAVLAPEAHRLPARAGPRRDEAPGAPAARRVSLTSLLQRWLC